MKQDSTTGLEKEFAALVTRFENAVYSSAKDDYQDGGSYSAMERRANAVRETKSNLVNSYDSLRSQNDSLTARVVELEAALVEIEKGEGSFSLDHKQHAINTIDNMKSIARAVLEANHD